MEEEDPKLHVVEVNDEVIDLRNKSFERPCVPIPPVRSVFDVAPFCRKMYGSEPLLQKAKIKKRTLGPRDKLKVSNFSVRFQENLERKLRNQTSRKDSLKKLTETLYDGPLSYSSVSSSTATALSTVPQPPSVVRNKPILRSKIPNCRMTATDPRFRRARSPSSRTHTLATQSESRVSPATSERRKSKSQSDSKFLLNSQGSDPISAPRAQIAEHQGDSAHSTKISPLYKSRYADKKQGNKDEVPTVKTNYSKDKSVDEDPTITESTDVGVSLYHSAVCGDVVSSKQTDKPFWDDPRLMDKYGKFLKPVSIAPRNSLSSWTLPIQKPVRYPQHRITEGDRRYLLATGDSQKRLYKRNCSKCVCTSDNETTVYTERSSKTAPPYESRKRKLYSLICTNYLLAIFFAVGSVCGLLLVALVVWVIANDLLWVYLQKTAVPKFTGIAGWAVYVCGGVIYGITYVSRMIGYLFMLPRNEVYEVKAKVNVTEAWYTSLVPWT